MVGDHDWFAVRWALFGQPDALAERGVAHCLFEGAEWFQILGRAPSDEAGTVAATEGQGRRPERHSGHPRQPDLINSGEVDILEISPRRVRFRDEEGRTFSFPHEHPQLHHRNHAWCSTVHGAQGRTSRGDSGAGRARRRRPGHVPCRGQPGGRGVPAAHRRPLEARPARKEGALDAMPGLDPTEPPAVKPELFKVLATDWRALQRQGEETGAPAYSLPGCEEVVARAAAWLALHDPRSARTEAVRPCRSGWKPGATAGQGTCHSTNMVPSTWSIPAAAPGARTARRSGARLPARRRRKPVCATYECRAASDEGRRRDARGDLLGDRRRRLAWLVRHTVR